MKNVGKLGVVVIIAVLVGCFFYFDLGQHLTLHAIKEKQIEFSEYYAQHAAMTIGAYMGVYIISTSLSLPGAALLTLLGGAMFGLVTGTIVVSFSSTIGATLAFLVSRFLLRDYVQERFGLYLRKINDGIKQEGAFYLFTLRLIPAVPFFVINLVMGLTPMKTRTFFFVSQIGMLAGTIVYINAGTQLAKIESLKGILSPSLLGSFIVLGLFPLAAKKAVAFFKRGSNEQLSN